MRNLLALVCVCLVAVSLFFAIPRLTAWVNSSTQVTTPFPSNTPTILPETSTSLPTISPSPSPKPSPIATHSPSPTPPHTYTPSPTPTISPSPTTTPFPTTTTTPSPSPIPSPSSTVTPSPTPTPSASPSPTPSPIPGGSAHDDLVNYALNLINSDRQSNGMANVTLSPVSAVQNHSDDMLENNYLSYWDTNGYKPHMRYTLAGGLGAVSENMASVTVIGGTLNPFDAITNLENLIMLSSQKTNILYPFHNEVSIGISYNSTTLYLVEDFENDHIAWTTLTQINGNVTMVGTLDLTAQSPQWIAVYYDATSTLSPQQLDTSPYYNSPCDLGTLIGAVLPNNNTRPGIIIKPQTWSLTGQDFQINFSLDYLFQTYGKGVYTLCLLSNLNETDTTHDSLTSYSIWFVG